MKCTFSVVVFVLLIGLLTDAQIVPTSNGSCSVSASGLMGCNWLSGIPMKKADGGKQLISNGAQNSSLLGSP